MKYKVYTFQEFIAYRNMIVSKAKRRTELFKDNKHNYYWLRLADIDKQYPEFKALGVIQIK
jgi:hypothetical protein